MPDAEKTITVLAPDGRVMNQTTFKKARRAVHQKRAVWVDESTIKLLMTKKERRRLYDEVIREANFICALCGEPCDPEEATVDHAIPLSRGGTDEKSNLVCAHKTCNERKGNLTLEEYWEIFGRPGERTSVRS